MSYSPPLIQCRHESRGAVVTLVVAGEVDLSTAEQFRSNLGRLIASAHSPAVVDLSAVAFMDSSGLNALMDASKSAAASDVDLVVVAPRGRAVRRVLDVSGLSEHLGRTRLGVSATSRRRGRLKFASLGVRTETESPLSPAPLRRLPSR